MGRAERYIVTIADDDRASLDKLLCKKLIAAGATLRRAAQHVRKKLMPGVNCSRTMDYRAPVTGS
jgi:hypothetical protein